MKLICFYCNKNLMLNNNTEINFQELKSMMPSIRCNCSLTLCKDCYILEEERIKIVQKQQQDYFYSLKKKYDFIEFI